MKLLVGSYTQGSDSEGIYTVDLDLNLGSLSAPMLASATVNPSFLLKHPHLPVLYCVNEMSGDDTAGRVSWFHVHIDGSCIFAGQISSGGQDPCHLAMNGAASLLAVSNYSSGSLTLVSVNSDGSLARQVQCQSHADRWLKRKSRLGRSQDRQAAAHVHSSQFSHDGQRLFIADLGSDEWLCQEMDSKAKLLAPMLEVAFAGASGPRHFCLSEDEKFAYVLTELSNTLVTIKMMDGQAEIRHQEYCLGDYEGFSEAAEVQMSADGRFLYISNRGADSIAVVSVSQDRVSLQQLVSTHGRHPRHFLLLPGYLLVACRDDNRLILLTRDHESGLLSVSPVAQLDLPCPVHLLPFQ
jgi:6-phosphogluconolactonase